jgi:hypothetical protein
MTITVLTVVQGSGEWEDARRGIITASTAGRLITPRTVKAADNVESRALTVALAAERINGWTDDNYVSFDMARGHEIEPLARKVYSDNYAPVTEAGFIIRDDWGFQIGYSPDGLVGDDGLIETKSRRPKEHLATILADEVPLENMAQLQCGILVSGREWIDYISYSGGMPLWTKRVTPDKRWRDAILTATNAFETAVTGIIARYETATAGLPMTERTLDLEEMRF